MAWLLLWSIADMRLILPIFNDRIAPLLDVAERFVLVEHDGLAETGRREVVLEQGDKVARARQLVQLAPDLVVCGAVTWPLEAMLRSAGVQVVRNTCGPAEEVIVAVISRQLTGRAFLLPGCRGPGRGGRRGGHGFGRGGSGPGHAGHGHGHGHGRRQRGRRGDAYRDNDPNQDK